MVNRWVARDTPNLRLVLQKVPELFLNRSRRARTLELGVLVRGPGTKSVRTLCLKETLPIIAWNATTPLVTASVLVHCRLTLPRFGFVLRREHLIETFTRLSTPMAVWWKLTFGSCGMRLKQLFLLTGAGVPD